MARMTALPWSIGTATWCSSSAKGAKYAGGSGPATGSTSTSLPAESGSTAAGTSLQWVLSAPGYANFSWNTSADDNFGPVQQQPDIQYKCVAILLFSTIQPMAVHLKLRLLCSAADRHIQRTRFDWR